MSNEEAAAVYGGVARFLHWLVVGLVVVVLGLGWTVAWTPRNGPVREILLFLHRSVGLSILAAMLLRFAWRLQNRPPPLPASLPAAAALAARATHWALYLLLILMPLAGYLNAGFAGRPVSFFGLFPVPPLFGENDRLSQFAILAHLLGQYFLYLFLALHLAAASLHGLVLRDGVVRRMLSPARPRRG